MIFRRAGLCNLSTKEKQTDERMVDLTKFARLSIGAALLTILLKGLAYWLTGSVGLLSDALESVVNLVAALLAWFVLRLAAQPPDEEHAYGHSKVEYFSSGVEGTLILIAALTIAVSAIERLLHPRPIAMPDVGLYLSTGASLVNGLAAWLLLRAGTRYRSITLEANARHLFTDVITSVGVILGVALTVWTGWIWLDAVVALMVAGQIIFAGIHLIYRSIIGLMDTMLPASELAQIEQILQTYQTDQAIQYHALRTRQAGRQRFASVHVQLPGAWTVQRGHTLVEQIERDIRHALAPISILIHLEPIEDPRSWEDISLNREEEGATLNAER